MPVTLITLVSGYPVPALHSVLQGRVYHRFGIFSSYVQMGIFLSLGADSQLLPLGPGSSYFKPAVYLGNFIIFNLIAVTELTIEFPSAVRGRRRKDGRRVDYPKR